MKYDLHTHTSFSDGEKDVAGNVERAIELGLDGIAICDHDNIDSWKVIDENKFAIDVIKGVELSTYTNGTSVHVLGYYKNDGGDYSELDTFLTDMRKRRRERIGKMIDLLKQFDIDLTYEEIAKYADGAIGRPHVAKAIIAKYPERNYTIDQIFDLYIGDGKPAYIRTYNLDTMDAIKLLHDNHCIAVLAHPLLIKTDKCNYKNIMKEFDGIEVFYAYMNEYGRYKIVEEVARKADMMMTGGSDYHGPNVRNTMGQAYVSDEIANIFLETINMKKKN